MPTSVLLNNIEHKNLRVITRRGVEFGDNQMLTPTFPSEFRDVQASYPIVFRKTTDGLGFESVALFGFQEGENLFLNDDRWDATYLPMLVERQPFQIGINGDELMVHIDIDSPRVSDAEGQAMFKEHGGNTDFLEKTTSLLLAIHQGLQGSPLFLAALLEHELLESFVLDIELNDGSQNRLVGFYTINEDRLAALGVDAVAKLHQAGMLPFIYMVIASLSNFRALIDRKNALHA
jgi:hypothetical protein